jgi:hypothetical protein
VLSSLPRVVVVAALCLSIGTQWTALQSVAWATMLIRNARHAPITEALVRTFDGKSPCNLCKGVSAAQSSEKKREAQPLSAKPVLICAISTILLWPRSADHVFAPFRAILLARVFPPPVPPPRSVLA